MAEKSLALREYLVNFKVLPYDKTPSFTQLELDKKLFLSTAILKKWKNLRKLTNSLIELGFLKTFSLNIDKSLKPKAYMHDNGQIFISLGLILTRSYLPLLSVYLHELAHIWLSQQANYQDLKKLQKEFRYFYSDIKDYELFSPIEVYADIITLQLLEEISAITNANKNKISKIIEARKEKLRYVYTGIKSL